jgi:aminopeptidase N
MEYPQVNLLGVELYSRFQNNTEILVAHEVAHQWWYQIVHNDPINMPWLDEALAEYSVKLYYERLHGPLDASLLERQRWQTPLDLLDASSAALHLNRTVDSFDDGLEYETIIYAKGALFYSQLRTILGDRRFQRFLREYLANHRYQIVDTETWYEALEILQLPELERLFDEWVGDPKPMPPTPTPVPNDNLEEDGLEEDSLEDNSLEESGDDAGNGDVEEEVPDTV